MGLSVLAAIGLAIREETSVSVEHPGYNGYPSLGPTHEEQWAVDCEQDPAYVPSLTGLV